MIVIVILSILFEVGTIAIGRALPPPHGVPVTAALDVADRAIARIRGSE